VAEPVDGIDTALKSLFASVEVDGTPYLQHVDDWEPMVNVLPAALFAFSGGTQSDAATGGITDNPWTWSVELLLSSLNAGTKIAIARFRDFWPAFQVAARADRTLGGLVYDWRVDETTGEPVYDFERDYLLKRFTITAITEEI
jgi:hypothetical protein